jgi:hypothetical protein
VQANSVEDSIIAGGNVDVREGGINFGSGDVHIEGPVAGRDIGHVGDVVYGDVTDDKITIGAMTGTNSGIAIGRGSSASYVSYGDRSTAADPARVELEKLVVQLNELLKQAPAEQQDTADAVAQTTQLLINQAVDDDPNPTMVQTMGTVLKQTAQSFTDNLPQIVDVAGKIAAVAATIAKATGG